MTQPVQAKPKKFNSVKVFCATMIQERHELGEKVTAWIEVARRTRPGFQLVDGIVRQSSDSAYHCISIVLFFNEDAADPAKAKSRG